MSSFFQLLGAGCLVLVVLVMSPKPFTFSLDGVLSTALVTTSICRVRLLV